MRVDATSVNQIDVRIRSGQVPIGPDLPTILGADGWHDRRGGRGSIGLRARRRSLWLRRRVALFRGGSGCPGRWADRQLRIPVYVAWRRRRRAPRVGAYDRSGAQKSAAADRRQLRPMRIRQNFLATDKDWATLHAGLRLVREVANQAPLHPFIAGEIAPGAGKISDASAIGFPL
jgi:hypothetical protein